MSSPQAQCVPAPAGIQAAANGVPAAGNVIIGIAAPIQPRHPSRHLLENTNSTIRSLSFMHIPCIHTRSI
ncbi:hypothetical protein ACFX15_029400 [Malus domestica]